jgi:hypothetical protein
MNAKARPQNHSVIIADFVGSREIASFSSERDARLKTVSRLHSESGLVLSPYTVTAWDEFQVILSRPGFIPRVIFDLRRLFAPYELWIAVGIGAATGTNRLPINKYAGGEAFERARAAADRLKSPSPKYRVLTSVETGNPNFDTIANTIYRLQDSLLEGETETQWATINQQEKTRMKGKARNMEQTAQRLERKVSVSTVSRSLRRGHYWEMVDTVDAMERIVNMYFPHVQFRANSEKGT